LPLLRMLSDGRVKTVQALFKGLTMRAKEEPVVSSHVKNHPVWQSRPPLLRGELIQLCHVVEARTCLENASLLQRISRRRCLITTQG
jgi:hypothetical protein